MPKKKNKKSLKKKDGKLKNVHGVGVYFIGLNQVVGGIVVEGVRLKIEDKKIINTQSYKRIK